MAANSEDYEMEHASAVVASRGAHGDASAEGRYVLQLDNVSKHFIGARNVTALDGISLNIARGEMVSIVGPSGSGKSTLLYLMGALDRASAGLLRPRAVSRSLVWSRRRDAPLALSGLREAWGRVEG